jgi:hypothetical protein
VVNTIRKSQHYDDLNPREMLNLQGNTLMKVTTPESSITMNKPFSRDMVPTK